MEDVINYDSGQVVSFKTLETEACRIFQRHSDTGVWDGYGNEDEHNRDETKMAYQHGVDLNPNDKACYYN